MDHPFTPSELKFLAESPEVYRALASQHEQMAKSNSIFIGLSTLSAELHTSRARWLRIEADKRGT